jgi:hypothetical protein
MMSAVNFSAASTAVKRQDGEGGRTARATPTVLFVVSKTLMTSKIYLILPVESIRRSFFFFECVRFRLLYRLCYSFDHWASGHRFVIDDVVQVECMFLEKV